MADQSIHPALKPGTDEVRFVLDGREVVGYKGESIINVAARENVHIPHYCWHPALSVAGNCRLCLVEIHMPNPRDNNKPMPLPKPAIACQTPIAAGMHVFTQSALAQECQRGMMEFLLANHPLDCPICDRGGECQLQRYSMEYGQGHARMHDKKRRFVKPQFDPLIDIERNRCIMCTRCVRFCDEVAGDHVMGVFDRGSGNYIGTFGRGPVSNILSGNVIDICPVGCLTNKAFRFRARVWELLQTQSTSIWDASGAKVTYWTRNGKLYRTTPPSRKHHGSYTVNEDTEEFIDNITRFGSDYYAHPSRWDESRLRIGRSTVPSAFIEAVQEAAEGLNRAKRVHGADSVAVLVSPRSTMEEGYLAGKLARTVLGTDNVDWRMSFQSVASAEAAALGFAHAEGDTAEGFDALILVNGDYLHQTPVFAMRVKEHARLYNKPVILIGHHHDRYFRNLENLHRIWCQPGETAKVLALLGESAGGSAAAKAGLAKQTGLADAKIDAILKVAGSVATKGLVLQSLEDMNGSLLAQEVPAALALRQALGAAWKYVPVLRDRNAFGLYAVGAQPGRLPAAADVVQRAWKLDAKKALPTTGGLAARGIVDAINSGKIKALLCLGADILHAHPDRQALLEALDRLEFFVLADSFDSEFARLAHVFLAAATPLEKEGTYCDVEGNLARLAVAEPALGGSRPEWEMLTGIANILGANNFNYESVADVFHEMIHVLAPGFQGTFNGLMLPGPRNDYSVQDLGGARKRTPQYNPGDNRVDGAHFRWSGEPVSVDSASIATLDLPRTSDGEFLVTWGEHVQGDDYHLNRSSMKELLQPRAYVEINPVDAARIGIETTQNHHRGVLSMDGAAHEVDVIVCESPVPGTLYVPTGLGGIRLAASDVPRVARLELLAPVETPAAQELVALT